MFNHRIKTLIVSFAMFAAIISLFSACSQSEDVYYLSNVDYKVSVPKTKTGESERFFISLPFNIICSKDHCVDVEYGNVDNYAFWDEDSKYNSDELNESNVVNGIDVVLKGENVEQLNSLTVSLVQTKLADSNTGENYYYENLKSSYDAVNNCNVDISKIKKAAKPYMDNCYLISGMINFGGRVKDDVRIDNISIPGIGLSCDFQSFEIDLVDAGTDIVLDDDDVIEYDSVGSGCFTDSIMHELNYYEVSGVAKQNVADMDLISLNDKATVIYSDPEESKKDSHTTSLKKEQEIQEDWYYKFNNLSSDCDSTVASLAFRTMTEDGVQHWFLAYQPTYIDGTDMLSRIINKLSL